MYIISASFSNNTSLFVSVNSTNEYVATASNDGNIKIRSLSQFTNLIPDKVESLPSTAAKDTTIKKDGSLEIIDLEQNDVKKEKITLPSRQIDDSPSIDKGKLELAQKPVNTVGVRSRSKITSLKYANLKAHSNLLAAVYKNGEVYIVKDPQNSSLCSVKQIFKHVNGLLLDFSWSADDQLLAFTSMNNEVIIYDVVYCRISAILHLHELGKGVRGSANSGRTTGAATNSTGTTTSAASTPTPSSSLPVKGISFDCTSGKYLLTLGDDKIVNILEYSLVSDPEEGRRFEYKKSQKLNHLISSSKLNKATIRKVSWSRDDRSISVPNTSKSKTTIVSLLKNENPSTASWTEWLVLTGYGFKCTMTQFSPCCYKDNSQYAYVLATASADSSIAIWKSNEDVPLFIAKEVSPQPVQDICWSQDGRLLFMTTSSGNLLVGVFSKEELGEVVPDSECKMSDIEEIASKQGPAVLTAYNKWVQENRDKKQQLRLAPKPELSGAPEVPEATSAGKEVVTNGTSPKKPLRSIDAKNGKKLLPRDRINVTSEFDSPSSSVPRDLAHKVSKLSRKADDSSSVPDAKRRREVEPSEFVGSVAINPQISFSNIRIAIPKIRWHLKYSLLDDANTYLEVRNGNGHESYPTRISLTKKMSSKTTKELFVDFIPNRVHIITGSSSFWALSTTNGQVIAYTNSGRRILPTIILGCPLSFLEMKDQYLLAVTSVGEMYAWDLRDRKALFRATSLYPLLLPIFRTGGVQVAETGSGVNGGTAATAATPAVPTTPTTIDRNGFVFVNGELLTRSENLTMCSITSTGLPIVTLSNGNGYLYNKDMGTWSLVSDSWWAFGSQYWDSTRSLASATSTNTEDSSLLNYLETHTNEEIVRRGKARFFSKISKVMLMREGYENLETVISLNHLENKINLYEYLNDYKNFKTYLMIYVKRLSELNLKDRLIEIFQDLFVDMEGKICGVEKKELLRELILSCSNQREVQRILVEYGEAVGVLG
ncbi:DEKNAAC105209 [Brettanomyces naardenensis]|uniref:Protein HIR n=1 Tax=Brettanomyces naardenensis TaxID=13370 RepID=A0A448YSS8_BRENA|nr:DEKNAAC105209 [Brettanomyces naardenensis]